MYSLFLLLFHKTKMYVGYYSYICAMLKHNSKANIFTLSSTNSNGKFIFVFFFLFGAMLDVVFYFNVLAECKAETIIIMFVVSSNKT